jgi:glyoxylase-like metal-dependent hydrolase (beta-lactamase superfamily II)
VTTFQRDVAPGVHRVEDAYVNWYLLEGEDRALTVVDAGLPRSWSSLQRVVRELGRSLDDVRALVLTHAHFDHVGFAERLRRRGVPVMVTPEDAELARHPLRYRNERSRVRYLANPRFLAIFGAMAAAGALVTPAVRRVGVFSDGEQLAVPGSPRVVATPGHTFGHVALHLPDRDAVIAGDALVMLDPYTGLSGPRLVAKAATADSAAAWASLDRLAALDATTVLTGHGEPWTQGTAAAVERARSAGQA